MKRRSLILLPARIAAAAAASAVAGQAGSKPVRAGRALPAESPARRDARVCVVLWFDTEDYILPASDDAVKRIAEFLTAHGVRATFKVVGEKARVLARRHRSDVIAALGPHEIGYHANTHSQHPTVAEYESVLNWQQGIEEFNRRERGGFDAVTRVFGRKPTCYGQPGNSWAPQVFPALKSWGVGTYLDDGLQVGLNGKPFWYGGLLNIYNIHAGSQLQHNADWSNLAEAKASFKALYAQMNSSPPGGLVSFYFHPTEFISAKFWDAVNFAEGANPPRADWKAQPERSRAQREQAFRYLEELVVYMKSFPDVQFVTASEAHALYRDRAQDRAFARRELLEIASRAGPGVTFQAGDGYALSASEVFLLVNTFLANLIGGGGSEEVRLSGTPEGPASPAFDGRIASGSAEVSWSQFSRTVRDVASYVEANNAVPNAAWFGSVAVKPESYLTAAAGVALALAAGRKPPDPVVIRPAELAAARYVAEDSPAIWKWLIFPPGFHSAHLMELARLQSWSLKPAILNP